MKQHHQNHNDNFHQDKRGLWWVGFLTFKRWRFQIPHFKRTKSACTMDSSLSTSPTSVLIDSDAGGVRGFEKCYHERQLQHQAQEQEPQQHYQQLAASHSQYASLFELFEWETTNIRLASSSNGNDNNQDCFLFLPLRTPLENRAQWYEAYEEKSEYDDRLRLLALNRYLQTDSALALSAKKVLFDGGSPTAPVMVSPANSSRPYDTSYCDPSQGFDSISTQPPLKRRHCDHQTSPNPARHPRRLLTSTNAGRILNVLQGEIAHCTPGQADVVVSDDATTCHILGLWSRFVCLEQGCWCGNCSEKNVMKKNINKDVVVKSGNNKETEQNVNQHNVMASMAHIDGPGYEDCLRKAFLEHADYHSKQHAAHWTINDSRCTRAPSNPQSDNISLNSYDDESRDGNRTSTPDGGVANVLGNWNTNDYDVGCVGCSHGVIEMYVHLMGGYDDEKGSSIAITDDVLRTLSNLAMEFDHPIHHNDVRGKAPRMRITLQTCSVTSANDDGTRCPMGRGLAMEVSTGNVFLAEVDEGQSLQKHSASPAFDNTSFNQKAGLATEANSCAIPVAAEGPAVVLRSTRLWARAFNPNSSSRKPRLNIIHNPYDDCLFIQPYTFSPHQYAKKLLQLSDGQLIQFTSTSPEVEKANFISKVRESLTFMNSTWSSRVFASSEGVLEPMRYRRVGLNGWIREL